MKYWELLEVGLEWKTKPTKTKQKQWRRTVLDGCNSYFPRLVEKKNLSKLEFRFFLFFFFPERGGFPTHNMYYCLENWEAKNQNLEWRVGQEYFRVRVTSVPQQCSRTNSSCAYTFPFLGYAGAHYISQNAPLAIQSFMSFLSHFPLQDETLWEI